jgi:hypothetical protein
MAISWIVQSSLLPMNPIKVGYVDIDDIINLIWNISNIT